jgi:hypothetical protein
MNPSAMKSTTENLLKPYTLRRAGAICLKAPDHRPALRA